MQSALSRREQILEYLDEKRTASYAALAREFSCSVSAIRRDIAILTTPPYNALIFTKSGSGGGIYVDESWHFGSRRLNAKQQELLERMLPLLQPEDRETACSILLQFGKKAYQKTKGELYHGIKRQ